MSTPRTASKTAKPSPRSGVALPLGAHPGNTGGKKGRSGRKPFEITAAARAIFEEHGLLGAAARIARQAEKDSDRLAAMKFLASYAFGQPREQVDVTSGGRPLLIVPRVA